MNTEIKIHNLNFEPFAKLNSFTKEDWYGFAGAEDFTDGRSPLIGEVNLDEGKNDGIIIVDDNGIHITLDQHGEETWEWTFTLDCRSEIRKIKILETLAILAKRSDRGVSLEDLTKDFDFQEL